MRDAGDTTPGIAHACPTGAQRSGGAGGSVVGGVSSVPGVARETFTAGMLRAAWTRQHDRVNARVETIARAVTALARGRLGEPLRAEAERAAHMLAGSLGMFGFIRAGEAARELEIELIRQRESPCGARTPAMDRLLDELREGLRGELVLRPDVTLHR